jgi:hypothetical protein
MSKRTRRNGWTTMASKNLPATPPSAVTSWSRTDYTSYSATSSAAREASRYSSSLSTSPSAAAAETTSATADGYAEGDTNDPSKSRRLPHLAWEIAPCPSMQRRMDLPSLATSPVERLFGSIVKGEGGRHDEGGARKPLATGWGLRRTIRLPRSASISIYNVVWGE